MALSVMPVMCFPSTLLNFSIAWRIRIRSSRFLYPKSSLSKSISGIAGRNLQCTFLIWAIAVLVPKMLSNEAFPSELPGNRKRTG